MVAIVHLPYQQVFLFFLCLFIYLPLHFQQVLVTQFLLTTGEEAQVSSENERLEGK